jgi:hypothetical protein
MEVERDEPTKWNVALARYLGKPRERIRHEDARHNEKFASVFFPSFSHGL